jgi:predicted Fe-Mo cluster-binding NifX family protein
MIAIPVLRGRVAPVLNWCSRIMIFPASPDGGSAQELVAPDLGPSERLQLLTARGVQIVICGALSPDLQGYAALLGMTIIPGVAGEIAEVLEAYRQNRLDQPEFWLPGCRGPRRYRQGFGNETCPVRFSSNYEGAVIRPGGRGAGGGQGGGGRWRSGGSGSGARTGVMAFCVCPACGTKAPHERGIPCTQVRCPQCGQPMVRE